jgi:manganese oxidase
MSDTSGLARGRIVRIWEIGLLSLVLSVGVVGFEFAVHVASAHATGGAGHGARDVLISIPMAVTAVCIGLWFCGKLGYGRSGPRAALNRSAVVSLVFGVLIIPSVGIHGAVDAFFGDGATVVDPQSGLAITAEGGGSLTSLALHGLHDALMGQALSLPLLFVALLLLGGIGTRRRQARPLLVRSRSLSRFAHAAVALATIGYAFGGPASGVAFAGDRLQTSASRPGYIGNPCDTAPHVTYNVSAINLRITLNRFGVSDPNSFMYVLDQNIQAVRAQEASGQVSFGLDTDPIQPLVIRAHMGECVTVNFTNRTTFGVAAMDQPPAPDPVNGCNNGTDTVGNFNPPACDGTLAQTAPENLAWNVDGLPGVSAADVSSAIGKNTDNTAAPGQTVKYTVFMDPALGEGAHAFHSTGDIRQLISHGLFGALISEPVGSQWLDPGTLQPIQSGWKAVIQQPSGSTQPNFREFALLFHEIGDEGYRQIFEKDGKTQLPVVDPFTEAYRPCSKGINYRSECFFERLQNLQNNGFIPDESQQYGSYMNGDMATPQPQMYVGDPYKTRLMNVGSEMAHVYHEHGGAIRWRRNPGADNPDIAGGLEKQAKPPGTSIRLDSQTIQPGESYDLEHECGAGGCQQAAADFLFHCHIANHYISGMLGFQRVFDTLQSGLATVPNRTPKPQAVNSVGLLGKVIEGKTVVLNVTDPNTQISLRTLVESQFPPQGVRLNPQDSTVWDWTTQSSAAGPIYLGEPEDTHVWADFQSPNPGQRPQIMFDPTNGRYAWPLLRPHLGQRPPFSPNGHSGAPWLGNTVTSTRPDGLCPANSRVLTYNITAITVPITETSGGLNPAEVDQNGSIFVLNEDKKAVLNGSKPAVPLAIRSDVGDCVAVTLTSELAETDENHHHSKVNLHTHFVQFDPQASDGVITGFAFEQSVQPDQTENRTLTAASAAGATSISVSNTSGLRPGITIEVGQGEPDTEIATISGINGSTVTLAQPLGNAHASGERAGTEFVQYRWYSDVDAGTVFFHDHVDGIHSWGHGLFAAHIIEPAGSTFHDPATGAEVRSGPIVDIWTNGSAGFGEQGSFREVMLWQHTGLTGNGAPQGCEMSSFNLRAAPLVDRDPNAGNPANGPSPGNSVPDAVGNYSMGYTSQKEAGVTGNTVNPTPPDSKPCSIDGSPFTDANGNPILGPNGGGRTDIGTANDPYVFSSVAHGDPPTPLLRAYAGDPVVIRTIGLDERVGDLRVTGHRFAAERFNANGTLTDSGTTGISERFDYVLDGGAGGPRHKPGDYLYYSGRNNEFESGAWGIFRVHDTLHSDLEVLPGRTAPPSGPGFPSLTFTGKAPPPASGAGNVCPSTAATRSYDVSIFKAPSFDPGMPGQLDVGVMYSLSSDEAGIKAGTKPLVPLVIRANAGDCLQVTLHNDLPVDNFTWTWGSGSTRAGFNVGNILFDPQGSYGAAIGFDPDSTVQIGGSRTYQYFVDKELGTNLVLNLGNESTLINGAYGAVIAESAGATYFDPVTGQPLLSGIAANIHLPSVQTIPSTGEQQDRFREFVVLYSDREPLLGHSIMIYYLDNDHSYIDYHEQSLTAEESSPPPATNPGATSLNNINLWQAMSNKVIGCTNAQAAKGTPATCTSTSGTMMADPATPVFRARAGDPVRFRVASAAGFQAINFGIMGHAFPLDHGIAHSMVIDNRTLLQGETFDMFLVNGAGGATHAIGDFLYDVNRRPMVKSGDWGIFRVLQQTDQSLPPL